jgi:hypothetical protein
MDALLGQQNSDFVERAGAAILLKAVRRVYHQMVNSRETEAERPHAQEEPHAEEQVHPHLNYK